MRRCCGETVCRRPPVTSVNVGRHAAGGWRRGLSRSGERRRRRPDVPNVRRPVATSARFASVPLVAGLDWVPCSWIDCRSLLSCGCSCRYGPVIACDDSSALNRSYSVRSLRRARVIAEALIAQHQVVVRLQILGIDVAAPCRTARSPPRIGASGRGRGRADSARRDRGDTGRTRYAQVPQRLVVAAVVFQHHAEEEVGLRELRIDGQRAPQHLLGAGEVAFLQPRARRCSPSRPRTSDPSPRPSRTPLRRLSDRLEAAARCRNRSTARAPTDRAAARRAALRRGIDDGDRGACCSAITVVGMSGICFIGPDTRGRRSA